MHKISRPGHHLLVEFGPTIDLDAIFAALGDVYRERDYADINDVWVIGDASIFVSHDDFETIIARIESGYPADAKRTKTALVCSTGFNRVVAKMWSHEAARLPYTVRVFHQLEDAQLWVES